MGALRSRRRRVAARDRARVPDLPEHERVEQAGRRAAGRRALRRLSSSNIPVGIGVHPDFGSFQGYGIPINVVPGIAEAKARPVPLRGSVRPRRLPDPEASEDRARLRRPHADRRPRPLPPVRAVRRAQDGVGLARRLGRDLEPALEPPAPRGMDERRRRRPSDPARPGALERGEEGRHRPRAPRHGAHHVQRASSTRRGTRPATRATAASTRRWVCACACGRLPGPEPAPPGPRHRDRDAALRDHRGRQRHGVVRPGRLELALQR